jgi:hypothetical protein
MIAGLTACGSDTVVNPPPPTPPPAPAAAITGNGAGSLILHPSIDRRFAIAKDARQFTVAVPFGSFADVGLSFTPLSLERSLTPL